MKSLFFKCSAIALCIGVLATSAPASAMAPLKPVAKNCPAIQIPLAGYCKKSEKLVTVKDSKGCPHFKCVKK